MSWRRQNGVDRPYARSMAVYGINYFVIIPMLFDTLNGSLPIPTTLSLDRLCQAFRLDQLGPKWVCIQVCGRR